MVITIKGLSLIVKRIIKEIHVIILPQWVMLYICTIITVITTKYSFILQQHPWVMVDMYYYYRNYH